MCTGFQVSSTRSRDLAEQIQGSARWGSRPDLIRPSPNRATFQAPPSVAEERGGFRGGGHLPPPRISLYKYRFEKGGVDAGVASNCRPGAGTGGHREGA